MSNQLRRVNIRITEEVHQFFKEKSISTGVSMSSLMYLALEEYVSQKNIMNAMPDMMKKIKELEEIKDMVGGNRLG